MQLGTMSIARADSAIATFAEKIFVIGGSPNGTSNIVECYDPLTNSWTSVALMNEKREGARAGVSNGYLYVVGGYTNAHSLSNIERYDIQTNTWAMVIFNAGCNFNFQRLFSL